MQRQQRLVHQMLGEQVGDEDESREQRQGQEDEARADQPEHHFFERIERRQYAGQIGDAPRAQPPIEKHQHKAVTAAANSSAAAAMDSRICAVSSQPGRAPPHRPCPTPVSDRAEGGARQQKRAERAVLPLDGDETGEHGERPGQQGDRLEQADGEGPVDAHHVHDGIAVSDDGRQAQYPGERAPSRGLFTLRSITQALAA